MTDDAYSLLGKRGRFMLDEHGARAPGPDDLATPIDLWVCPRFDEPETWMPPIRLARCVDCGTSVTMATNPTYQIPPEETPKICIHCAWKRTHP